MVDAEIKEDVIDRPIKDGRGPPCFWKLEFNRQTRQLFDGGKKPRQGNCYVWKCIRFDGKRAYFVLARR